MGADSLYYIRDYSGNYYRINNVNELVAVRNETDATVFNYDQAKSHIGTGKKSAFYRAIPIETEDGNDGGDIAFNSVEVREEPDVENQYENISAVKELTYEEMIIEERKNTPFDGKKNDWYSFAKQQADFYRNAAQYIANLKIHVKTTLTKLRKYWTCLI